MRRLALLSLLWMSCPQSVVAGSVAGLATAPLAAIDLPAVAALAATDGKAGALQFATAMPVAYDLRHGQ